MPNKLSQSYPKIRVHVLNRPKNPKRTLYLAIQKMLQDPNDWVLHTKLGIRHYPSNIVLYLGNHPWLELKIAEPTPFAFTPFQRLQLALATRKIKQRLILKALNRGATKPRPLLDLPEGVKFQNN